MSPSEEARGQRLLEVFQVDNIDDGLVIHSPGQFQHLVEEVQEEVLIHIPELEPSQSRDKKEHKKEHKKDQKKP